MAAKSTHGIKNHITITSMERGRTPLVQDLSGKRLEALQKIIKDQIDNKKPNKYSKYYEGSAYSKTYGRGRPNRKSYKRKSSKRKSSKRKYSKRKSSKRKSSKRKSSKRKSYRHF